MDDAFKFRARLGAPLASAYQALTEEAALRTWLAERAEQKSARRAWPERACRWAAGKRQSRQDASLKGGDPSRPQGPLWRPRGPSS